MDKQDKTPLEDLRQSALKHYDEVSSASHFWKSDIPEAINFYYDHLERQENKKDITYGWALFMIALYLIATIAALFIASYINYS